MGTTFNSWQAIAEYTKEKYPNAVEEWNFRSEKYGWSFRLKDTKRVLVYLSLRDMFFKVAFVFGQKATDVLLESSISEDIKMKLKQQKFMLKVAASELISMLRQPLKILRN